MSEEQDNLFYLSVYAEFNSDKERRLWMKDHVVKNSIPHNGPIYSFSTDKESDYRDLSEELLEALECLMGRLDSHFGGNDCSYDWKEQEKARAVIGKAKAAKESENDN